jgi:hypothetical protein
MGVKPEERITEVNKQWDSMDPLLHNVLYTNSLKKWIFKNVLKQSSPMANKNVI